jgi:hypothetical protein
MEQHVSVNNTGIDSAGLPTDYMAAVGEFIWNAFDANATHVDIQFTANSLDFISSLTIVDNGQGIDLDTINQTFGNFMDSLKKSSFRKSSSSVRGNKGKGRFSFAAFASAARWETTFRDTESDRLLDYTIDIHRNSKNKYVTGNRHLSKSKETGTNVRLYELFNVTAYSFSKPEFVNYLAKEFGWFLLLNKEKQFRISINGEPISYQTLIAESDAIRFAINKDEKLAIFRITFVRWQEKIGDKFYFYFLNGRQTEVFKELTSFNNNALGFNHSVYVESDFFDNFNPNDKEQSLTLDGSATKSSPVFKSLAARLQKLLREKQKNFVNEQAASQLIEGYERSGVIPPFKTNKYDQARKADLVNVVKAIYCIEPKLFQGLNKEQQKISVGLINILLEKDERETILELIGRIISMTAGERNELSQILQKTTMANITKMVSLIEDRYRIILLLKSLVYDQKRFTSEIRHLQKAIEENYWLFGEQYHLVSANEAFNQLHDKYVDFLNGNLAKGSSRKEGKSMSPRRPDLFLCRKRAVPDLLDHELQMEENIMVELKRPSVEIGVEQVRQIEDYMEIIRSDDAFNSQKRLWKFIVIGNKVDEYVKGQYESMKEKNRRFLVKAAHNYEIYAYSWDDIFTLFDLRHSFLADHLNFDKEMIRRQLIEKGIELNGVNTPEEILEEVMEH